MLPLALVEEVRRLLDAGTLSQRQIAEHTGVSRGTVSAIASGKRGMFGHETSSTATISDPLSPPERCGGCGALVVMPCVLCRARAYRDRREVFRATSSKHSPKRVA
jgi:hypothetical protein